MQRSCADVNSPYKRKCWTNSGGLLVYLVYYTKNKNNILYSGWSTLLSPPPPLHSSPLPPTLSDDYWHRHPGNFGNFLRRQQFVKASSIFLYVTARCCWHSKKDDYERKRSTVRAVCILRFSVFVKGIWHKNFRLQVFFVNHFPPGPDNTNGGHFTFLRKFFFASFMGLPFLMKVLQFWNYLLKR